MIALRASTTEAEVAATIDELRRAPARCDELVALLPERASLWDGRTSAEVTRLRGWLLAAFADAGLPAPALPYALEVLQSGHMPYEVAGAAIAVRGFDGPAIEILPYLLRALRNMRGVDAAVSFERYDPRWPFAEPTTALTEVLRTIAGLGKRAASAASELERLAEDADYSERVRAQMGATVAAVTAAPAGCGCGDSAVEPPAERSCCGGALVEPSRRHAAGPQDVTLEDQDGRPESFMGFFSGKPSVVAFFYTRCDNPNKCSLTVTRLAELQALLRERGLAGAVRLAAVTYDPEFDLPKRLKLYASDRGLMFDDDSRCFRATAGFDALSHYLGLHVNYGPSTVNRHQIEAYVLDSHVAVAASLERLQWSPQDVMAVLEPMVVTAGDPSATR